MNIFTELRKRRVFATAAIYISGAWLIAEILLAVFERFAAPTWVGDVVVILFLLGFPVALLMSWLFDVSSDGVKRASAGTPLGIMALLASGLFLSVGAYVSYQVFSGRLAEIRIAVLPLRVSDSDSGAQPFGSGIADGVRNQLREIPLIGVSAHTSSEAIVQAGLDIPAIALKLGVDYVLEGTLESIGDSISISVALLDRSGDVLWSDRYKRATRDIFGLQNDLVRAVAIELGVSESDQALQALARKPPPTQVPEAHRLYLQGKYSTDMSPDGRDNKRLEFLKAARELDPGYAAIYPAIAQEYATDCWGLDDRKNPDCELAINFSEQGLLIDPDSSDALATLALVHSIRYDYELAQNAIDRFYALPSHTITSQALPWAYLNLGRLSEAWESAEEFYRNDPLNMYAVGNMATWSWSINRNQEMSDHYDVLLSEILGVSILAAYPYMRVDSVTEEQALNEGRMVFGMFGNDPEMADILIPYFYHPELAEQASAELQAMFEEGRIRPAQYWLTHAESGLGRVDEFIDKSFEMYDDNVLNPVFFWLHSPGSLEIRSHPRFVELMEYIGIADYWDDQGWPHFCVQRNEERFCDLEFQMD